MIIAFVQRVVFLSATILLLVSGHAFADYGFIPDSVVQGPVKPEITGISGLGGFGSVGQQDCKLRLSENDVSIPGNGLLSISLSRSYELSYLDVQKSDEVISAYVDSLYSNPYTYNSGDFATFALLFFGDVVSGNSSSAASWFVNKYNNNATFKAEWDINVRPSMIRKIKEDFEMYSPNHFYQNEKKRFGSRWSLGINGLSRIYVWEMFENVRDTASPNDKKSRFYWHYKAIIPNGGVYEKNFKDYKKADAAFLIKYDDVNHAALKLEENKDNDWNIGGLKANGIDESQVVVKQSQKLRYSSGVFELVVASGIKYIFARREQAMNEATYYANPYPSRKRVEKYIMYLTRIEDKYGNYIDITYDGSGKITEIKDKRWVDAGAGKKIRINYIGDGISEIKYPNDSGTEDTVSYTYNGDALATAVNPLGQATTYEYYPIGGGYTGELKKVSAINGLSVVYDYILERFWLTGYEDKQASELPTGPVRSMYEPTPQNIVTSRIMYEDGIQKNQRQFFKTTYFLWTLGENSDDPSGTQKNFWLDAAVAVFQEPLAQGNKLAVFKFNNRGLLFDQIDPLSGCTHLWYAAGTPVKYYLEPTEMRKGQLSYDSVTSKLITNYISRVSNVYDASGLLTTSYTYKNPGDINYYTRADYQTLVEESAGLLFHLPLETKLYEFGNAAPINGSKAEYNASRDMQRIYRWDGTINNWAQVQRATYDAVFPWQVVKTYGAFDNDEGKATRYEYDSTYHAAITKVLNSAYSVSYEYFAESRKIKRITDENANVFDYVYDALGRLTESYETGDGTWTKTMYDDAARKVSSERRYNSTVLTTSETTYNYLGKSVLDVVIDKKTGITTRTKTSYLDNGNIWQKTENPETANAITITFVSYDLYDRPLQITYANGYEKFLSYNFDFVNNWVVTTTDDSHGKRTITRNDFLGRTVETVQTGKVVGSKEYLSRMTYSSLGKVLTSTFQPTLPSPIVYQNVYDPLGRLQNETLPGNVQYSYTYYADDTVKTVTAPTGTETRYYDDLRRITKIDYPISPDINYYYDDTTAGNKGRGKLTKKEKVGVSSSEYVFGAYGRQLKETKRIGSFIYTTENAYNSYGIIASVKLPNGKSLVYDNDYTGHTWNINYDTKKIAAYQYDFTYRLDNFTYNNDSIKTTYRYFFDTLDTIDTYIMSGATVLDKVMRFKYRFDRGVLNALDEDIEGRSVQYSYDSITEALTEAKYSDGTSLTYAYDGFYNRVNDKTQFDTHQYFYENANNRLSYFTANNNANAKTMFGYDGAGNTVSVTEKSGARTQRLRTFAWTDIGQISGLNDKIYPQNNKLPTVEHNSAYEYDENNLRIKKTVNGKTTYYIRMSSGLTAEANSSGVITRTYLGGIAFIDEVASKTYYLLKDRLGSVCRVLDENNSIVQANEYDPFGNVIHSRSKVAFEKEYTGKALDDESGLFYFGARYYKPEIGRWLSVDPARQHLNLYLFSRNNPLGYIDTDGRTDWIPMQSGYYNTFGGWSTPTDYRNNFFGSLAMDTGSLFGATALSILNVVNRVSGTLLFEPLAAGANTFNEAGISLGMKLSGSDYESAKYQWDRSWQAIAFASGVNAFAIEAGLAQFFSPLARTPVAIGRGMKPNIIPLKEAYGIEYYTAPITGNWEMNSLTKPLTMFENWSWINRMKFENRIILNQGDFGLGLSDYYWMELESTRNYIYRIDLGR